MRSPHSLVQPDPGGTVVADARDPAREIRLRAESAQLVVAREHVERAAVTMGFDDRATHEIVFAVNEAVTNAIRHGRPDGSGTIGLLIECDDDGLTVVVSDSGAFLPSVPDGSPMAESGRGFVFMSGLMDQVDLTRCPEGTMVRLHKGRPGASAGRDDGD